jgi:hypothetical protein
MYTHIHRVWLSTWSGGFGLENSKAHVIIETRHSSMHMAYASLCITWKFERDLKEGERAWPKRRNGSSHYVSKALEMESEIGKLRKNSVGNLGWN